MRQRATTLREVQDAAQKAEAYGFSSMVVPDHVDQQLAALERIANRLGISADEVGQTPAYLVGSPEAILAQLCYWREACGFSYYTVGPDDLDRLAPLMEKAIALDSR